ncbi:MAG: PAS domain-containing protein, partial [Firmicutes bacterium]|nr:PAS domain-containing protein [Bacillota bacterium]
MKREEKQWECEERFRAVFEGAAIGIALVDMEGRIIDSNPSFQKMLGY